MPIPTEPIGMFRAQRTCWQLCELALPERFSSKNFQTVQESGLRDTVARSDEARLCHRGDLRQTEITAVIAGKVQKGGKHVAPEDIARARQQGAPDKEIHDTVLIAAAFCMFNRYVDGLDTWQPTDPNDYREMGKIMARVGYARPDWEKTGEAA